nr:molybdenum ABC transporter ATP-binding protein [Pararhizobium sp. IMCC21322]
MGESPATSAAPILDVQIHGVVGTFQLRAKFRSQGLATAVFGHSGAGKTSLIQMLAGLRTPQSGHIRIGDTVVYDSAAGINVPVEERRVGMVFQDSRLFPHMSVERNLTYSHWAGGRLPGLRFDKVIQLLSLENLLKRNPLTLSGGEQQRVAIGRALLSDPRILLLDEPLASLDNARKQNILPFIERVAQESRIPICYVSHSMDEVTRIADDLVVLSRGKTIASGPLTEILTRVDLGGATGRHEAGAIVSARVVAHDDTLGLTQLMLQTDPPLQFELARSELPIGADVRLRIRARDVSIAVQPVAGLSIRNQLPARIETVKTDEQGYAELVLRLGADGAGAGLRARITAASALELQLEQGDLVFALVKSIAIERRLLQPMIEVAARTEPNAEPTPAESALIEPAANESNQPETGRLDIMPQRDAVVDRQLAAGLAAEFLDVEKKPEQPIPDESPDPVSAMVVPDLVVRGPVVTVPAVTYPTETNSDLSEEDTSVAPQAEMVVAPETLAAEPVEVQEEPHLEPDPEPVVEERAEEPVPEKVPNPFLMDAPTIKR